MTCSEGRAELSLYVGKTNEHKTPLVTVTSVSAGAECRSLFRTVMSGESYLFASSTSGHQPPLNKLSEAAAGGRGAGGTSSQIDAK